MKGFRSILLHTGIAAGTAGLTYLGGYDWVSKVGPVGATAILSGIAIAMRFLTTTAVGKSQ